MNCEDFRIQIDAEPAAAFDGRDAHLAECSACERYAAEASSFENLVIAAMNVSVPEFDSPAAVPEVSNVVELKSARAPAPTGGSFSGRVWMSLAASLALAVFVAYRFVDTAPPDSSLLASEVLATQVLGHLVHEPYAIKKTSQAVPYAAVENVVRPVDAEVSEQIGLISYAQNCVINGESVPHLVVQGKYGPVTIMIMPNESVSEVVPLENDQFHGAIVPAGEGSIAIIGRKGESIDDIRSKIGESIRLSI